MHEEVRFSTVDTVSTFSRNILMCGCVGCKHKMRKSVFQPVPGSPFISRPPQNGDVLTTEKEAGKP
jgi:hypothetical protein